MLKSIPTVTIGVSIYRQPLAWIQDAVRSALEQTLPSIDVIVRIDGPDGLDADGRSWLLDQKASDKRLVLIDGLTRLGNFGSLREIFCRSSADYLIQLDADDMLFPSAAEQACSMLDSNIRYSFVYTNCFEISESGEILGVGQRQCSPYEHNRMLVQFITFHMRCIRREAYELVGGYRADLLYCGDYDLSLRLSEIGAVGYLPECLYLYRLHKSNESLIKQDATRLEGFMVARSAFYRRGLAVSHYLLFSPKSISLLEWSDRTSPESNMQALAIPSEYFSDWLL